MAFPDGDRKKSAAFVILCLSTVLGLSPDEAGEWLTEGGGDFGVDALYFGDVIDGEFLVTLVQAKYSRDLDKNPNFPENGVAKAIEAVGTLFDPDKRVELNEKLAPRIEEIRSLIRDGYLPRVRVVLCNNGQKWNGAAQKRIDSAGFDPNQVEWVHWNHDSIVAVQQSVKSVNAILRFHGRAVVEDFNFRRVLLGRLPVTEVAELFNRHGDLLLEKNIRRYLGLHANRVNRAIHETLCDPNKRDDFYFFNNGLTMICRKFSYNALQEKDYQVKLEGLQIINGGQTGKTIQQALSSCHELDEYGNVYVLTRIYELAEDDQSFVRDITYATNSQNPVDLRDLRSNDDIQRQLEIGLRDLGYTYKRQRDESPAGPEVITSAVLAEAVLAVWCRAPHQAKFNRSEHFGSLYHKIFDGLTPALALVAVLIFRFVENQRKRPEIKDPPPFLPYASHYLAMLMGMAVLLKKSANGVYEHRGSQVLDKVISHQTLPDFLGRFEAEKDRNYMRCVGLVWGGIGELYGERQISLQQLAATFRRGDLLEYFFQYSSKILSEGALNSADQGETPRKNSE